MKGRYITLEIRLACLSTKQPAKRDIHAQLMETIREHKKIMQQLTEFIKRHNIAA